MADPTHHEENLQLSIAYLDHPARMVKDGQKMFILKIYLILCFFRRALSYNLWRYDTLK